MKNWLPDPSSYPAKRLFCLDALRGIDMFLLVAMHGVLVSFGRLCHFGDGWFYHLGHPAWIGFSFWDMIMPLFIFMCGAALPLALGRRIASGASRTSLWRHVLARVALLWFLGMLTQGRLFTLDPMKISPYNNTLQTIAAGYFIAFLVMQIKAKWVRWVAPAAFALIYAALMHFCGDYTQNGNFAAICEKKILSLLLPAGSEAFSIHNYTWFLTTFMFAAMTMCGVISTDILTSSRSPWLRTADLALFGVGLLAFGFISQIWIPSIKHVFTLSFTAQAMGYAVLSLATLHALCDVLGFRRGTDILLLYGQCALAAYVISHVFYDVPSSIRNRCLEGIPRLLGNAAKEWMPLVSSLLYAVVLTFIVALWRQAKIARQSDTQA